MKKIGLTAMQERIRFIQLLMPLAFVVLLTGLFWGLGGGKGRSEIASAMGFLMRLPGARVGPVTRLDKMGYYDLARRDSATERQRLVIQANYARQLGLDGYVGAPAVMKVKSRVGNADANAARVREKLESLKRVMAGSAGPVTDVSIERKLPRQVATKAESELGQLERVMNVLQRDEGGNADIRELGAVVEKLLAVQRGKEDTGRQRDAGGLLAVNRGMFERKAAETRATLPVRALPEEEDTVGGFDSTAIEAIVPEETVLLSGGELRLELVRDVVIGRQRVPAGTAIFGTGSLSGERLRVSIGTMAGMPVGLEVRDEDGMLGVYVPGAPMADAVHETAAQELGVLGPGVMSTNLAGQAASAGVVLARGMIGHKIRPVKVTIPAGYRVLLQIKTGGI